MTDEVKDKLKRYADIIVEGKPEPMTPLERKAWKTCDDILAGNPPEMDWREADRITDAYLAKPDMTEQQWLDLEKEVNQFIVDQVDCFDPEYLPFAHEMGVLHRTCEAIRLTQEEKTAGS